MADSDKAHANVARHGIEFEQAAQVFFDPFFRIDDASGEDEAREAAVGYDYIGRLLFVVHIDDRRRGDTPDIGPQGHSRGARRT